MPFTVITVKNAPMSLRGDLSKWMQEISTGVYVGNFNTKVREKIWLRVNETIGNGEATLSYYCRNEIGYNFDTMNTAQRVVNHEGIPLLFLPNSDENNGIGMGFSNAKKTRNATKYSNRTGGNKKPEGYVVIDIETDGLDEGKNSIIEIGAIKIKGNKAESFSRLIRVDYELPPNIVNLTNITDEMLDESGGNKEEVLKDFLEFIEDLPIVGYNLPFDIKFIKYNMENLGLDIQNKQVDLLPIVRENTTLANYKLLTVAKHFGIAEKIPHRGLLDAGIILELSKKLKEFTEF